MCGARRVFNELARDGQDCARWNLLHPGEKPRLSHVEKSLAPTKGPVIAATDYVRLFADQIRAFVPRRYAVLGADGFGRSDTREKLRAHFEIDRRHIALAALSALAADGDLPAQKAREAIRKYQIDPARGNPLNA